MTVGARRSPGVVASLALLATGLALFRIGHKSLWSDEAVSALLVAGTWSDLLRTSFAGELNMLPYHLLLFPWARIDSGEAFLRGFSALFAVATIPLLHGLTARLFEIQTARAATLFLAVNAFFISYAQEVRAYALLLFLVTLSSYLAVRIVDDPDRKRFWTFYVVTGALAVNTHLFAGFVIVAHFVSLFFLPANVRPWRRFLAATGAIAALSPVAWLLVFRDSGHMAWATPVGIGDLLDLVSSLAGIASFPPVFVYGALIGVALLAAARTVSRQGRSRVGWSYALVIGWLVLPVGIVFLYSLVMPVFAVRYLLICLPPFVMLGALGLVALRRPWRAAALAAVLLFSCAGLYNWYFRTTKENWREAARFVLTQSKSRDAVGFFVYFMSSAYEYYDRVLEAPGPRPRRVELSSGPYWIGGAVPDPDLRLLEELPGEHDRLWLLLSHDTKVGRREQRDQMLRFLDARYPRLSEREFHKVRVLLYGLNPTPAEFPGQDTQP